MTAPLEWWPRVRAALIALGVAVAAVALFLVGRSLGRIFQRTSPLEEAGRAHDAGVDGALDRIDTRAAAAGAALEAEATVRTNLADQGRAAAARREETNAALDDASTVADVDAVVYGRRGD